MTAITFFVVIFIAAVADASEFRAASRAFHVIKLRVFIDADGVAAIRAFHFNEIIVATITIVIAAVAAIAIIVSTVDFFFEHTEIFVDLFDIGVEIFSVFLEFGNFLCDIAENIENCVYDLIVHVKTFCEALDVSNFFRNVHLYSSFLYALKNGIIFHF